MYRVTVKTDGTEYLLHDPRFNDTQIYNDELSEEMGKTPTFTFDIPAGHPNADKLLPLSSEVFVYRDDEIIFYGREISPSTDLYNTRTVECVGALSYLADSMIAPFAHTGSLTAFLSAVIEKHNAMVEARKQFTLGLVTISGETGYREVTGYTDALSLLSNLIVGAYGGYLRVRLENGVQYLDYVEDYGGTNSQQVRFGENVLDLTRQIDASDVVTCLIAQGAEDENGSFPTVTVMDDAAIAKWGKIWAQVTFDSITDAAALQAAAEAYLLKLTAMPERVEFNALDLHLADVDINALQLGYWTHFVSEPHEISGDYLLRKRTLHITAPQNDTVIFGTAEEQTLTGTSLADKKAAEDANAALQDDMEGYIDDAFTNYDEVQQEKWASFTTTIDGLTSEVGTLTTTTTAQGKKIEENTSLISQTASAIRSEVSQKITTVENEIESVEEYTSSVEQTAQKINWIVKSGYSASSMTLTDRMLSIISDQVQLYAPDMSNYAKISVNSSGLYLEPNAGTVYIGSSNGYVYARNSFEAFYIYCDTQIRSGGNIVSDGQVAAYSGKFSGWCYAPDWTNGSDLKLKKEIENLPEDLFYTFIMDLKPVQYRYKADTSKKLHFGFIAQDVQASLEAIGYQDTGALVTAAKLSEDDTEDTLTLSYNDLIAPLVTVVQRMHTKIEKLEGKLNAYEGN